MLLEAFPLDAQLSPTSLFAAMRQKFGAPCAMLESGLQDEGNQFSLIAACPIQEVTGSEGVLERLETAIEASKKFPKIFPFSGGMIGRFNWEIFGELAPENFDFQDFGSPHAAAVFYEFSRFFAFDHKENQLWAIQTAGDTSAFSQQNQALIVEARKTPASKLDLNQFKDEKLADYSGFSSQHTKSDYCAKVERVKQQVSDGEIFQLILSNSFSKEVGERDGLEFYEVLRRLEPTTHLVFFDFGEHGQIGGASPEILGTKRGQSVTYRPIAATRYRGKTREEDERIFQQMAADPKENAEHDMLIDLGRNDLGRVCETGSVRIEKEKYGQFLANVMHLVSDLKGELKKGVSAVDFFQSIFPAGTLSGAPKLRAIKLIGNHEQTPRDLYGGAMGYFSADGDMELCIAIRSFFLADQTIAFRTGAGVVQDSVPEQEWLEVHNKAKTLCKVINGVLSIP